MSRLKVSFSLFVVLTFLFFKPGLYGNVLTASGNDPVISELHQKIFIAFNGEEEIIAFTQILVGEKNPRVFRFIPFPSEPEVYIAEEDVFAKTLQLMQGGGIKPSRCYKGGKYDEFEGIVSANDMKTTPTDISILTVKDLSQFNEIIGNFKPGRDLPMKLSSLDKKIIKGYLEKGYNYFVFDNLETTGEWQIVQPVIYKFKTGKLIFPLETLNLFRNEGTLEVFVFSSEKETVNHIGNYLPFCPDQRQYEPDMITAEEINRTASLPDHFFKKETFFKVYRYWGNFDFKNDIDIQIHEMSRLEDTVRPDKKFSNIDESRPSILNSQGKIPQRAAVMKKNKNKKKELVKGGKKHDK